MHLQPKTFELLDLLVQPSEGLEQEADTRERLWPETAVAEASLTVAVAELRASLGDDAKKPRYVRTVYGFGYAFAGEIDAGERGAEASVAAPRPASYGRSGSSHSSRATTCWAATRTSRSGSMRRGLPPARPHPRRGDRPRSRTSGARTARTSATRPRHRRADRPADHARFRLGRVLLVFRASPSAARRGPRIADGARTRVPPNRAHRCPTCRCRAERAERPRSRGPSKGSATVRWARWRRDRRIFWPELVGPQADDLRSSSERP